MPSKSLANEVARGGFPKTRHSAFEAIRSDDYGQRQVAYETIFSCYWKPTYKYIRLKWRESPENAEDLTQSFLAAAFEKRYFDSFDPSKARFHSFLRLCVDRFIGNRRKEASRLKRGGDSCSVSLDFEDAEQEIALHPASATLEGEDFFEREWLRSLVSLSIEKLRRECIDGGREVHFTLFEKYDLDRDERDVPVSYQDLATELGLTTIAVTNHLASVRRAFRRILLSHLRELTATEAEYRDEARRLLGRAH